MRVEFILTKRDLWHYYWYSCSRHIRRRVILLAAFCLILPALNFIPGYGSGVRNTLAVSAFFCVLVFLTQIILYVMHIIFGFRKILKPGITGGRVAEIGKFDFSWGASASQNYCHHWSNFEGIVKAQHAIYFVLKGSQALIVPKTAFADAAQEGKFLAAACQHWETAKTNQRYAAIVDEAVWPPPPRIRN